LEAFRLRYSPRRYEGTRATLDFVLTECRNAQHFDGLSAIALGHWPVLLTACRHHSLPIPPHLWLKLLPQMGLLKDTK